MAQKNTRNVQVLMSIWDVDVNKVVYVDVVGAHGVSDLYEGFPFNMMNQNATHAKRQTLCLFHPWLPYIRLFP